MLKYILKIKKLFTNYQNSSKTVLYTRDWQARSLKGQYFKLCRPSKLFCNNSTLLLQHETDNSYTNKCGQIWPQNWSLPTSASYIKLKNVKKKKKRKISNKFPHTSQNKQSCFLHACPLLGQVHKHSLESNSSYHLLSTYYVPSSSLTNLYVTPDFILRTLIRQIKLSSWFYRKVSYSSVG